MEKYTRHLNGNCIANHEESSGRTLASASGSTVPGSTATNILDHHPPPQQLSQRDQNVQMLLAAEAEVERNRKAAEQEALLRDLKGYEAGYQYQPRSNLLDGSSKYGGMGPNGPGPGDGPPMTNTNALPGADKRSCSQWRMTLFVFYWIIWIVFLIGVVIIVAANARTA